MTAVHLRSLGECLIETDEVRLGPDSKYVFAAGLYLVLERGKQIPRETLVDLLWPDVENAGHAKHRLRQVLLRLKQCGVPIVTQRVHITLPRDAADTDFDRVFEANGDAWERLRERQSYEFLPGYGAHLSHAFATWMEMHRARVQTAIQRVIGQALYAARARGDWPEVERIAIECLRLDPYHEEATMARAEAAVMRGSKMQALAILDAYMEALGEKSVTIGLPAKLLRSRIAERINQPRYAALSERHFVGREAEMEQLTQLVDEARRGRGGGCLIWGDPGIGKSRLLQEISRVAEMKGVKVVTVRCQPPDVNRPLSVFADAIPTLKTLPGALGVSSHSVSLLQRLTERDRENLPAVPREPADAELLQASIRRAILDLFDAVVNEAPTLFTVEDIQWLDGMSWSVLRSLIEWSTQHKIGILLSARTPHATSVPTPDPDRGFRRLLLKPLDQSASVRLLAKLLETLTIEFPVEMEQWCVAVAEGNPFYLRELIIQWLESQRLFDVPRSLADLIGKRTEVLSPPALRLLQLCVLLGIRCTFDRLEKAGFGTSRELLASVDELSTVGMLVADGSLLRVKHDLLAEAALARLSVAAKQLLHRQVARLLEEEILSEHSPALLWDCAHHWEFAGEARRVASLTDEVAQHLLVMGLPRDCAALYERALARGVSDNQDMLRFQERRISALRIAGDWKEVLCAVQRWKKALGESPAPALSHSSVEIIEFEALHRTNSANEDLLRRILACVESSESTIDHRLHAAFWFLALATNLGLHQFAEDSLRSVKSVIDLAEGDSGARLQVAMVYHADYGDLTTAVDIAQELIAKSRAGGDPLVLVRALRNGAIVMGRVGDVAQARAYLTEAWRFAERYHAGFAWIEIPQMIGMSHLYEGDLVTAVAWFARAEQATLVCDNPFAQADLQCDYTMLAILTGDLSHASDRLANLPVPGWEWHPSLRMRQEIAALSLAISALNPNRQVDREALAFTESAYAVLRDRGHQDFVVYALLVAYNRAGQQCRARTLFTDYIRRRFRRERGPLLRALQQVASEVLATDLLVSQTDHADAGVAATRSGG